MAFDSKNICLALLRAESEADVQAIIDATPEMADPGNWALLDNRETNFNVVSNQASDGGKALTELMTNMVDAVLTRHAYQKDIDPRGKTAPTPQNMYDAVRTLVAPSLHGGKLSALDPKDPWLKDFAIKNLVIGVTGSRRQADGLPCYTFIDNGEGQCAEDFTNTFLSLSAGNKKSIPFVQGKYNMGSSGVLRYCGERWFKLIVSRRYDGKAPWAWTIMRQRPDSSDMMPVVQFFTLPDGAIPSFEMDYLYPLKTTAGNTYDGVLLETGTVVKLYDYNVGRSFLSFRGAREALNENLVETILPFRILDLRQTPDKKRTGDRALGVDARSFYGMEFLLLRSHKETELDDEDDVAADGDQPIFVGSQQDPELGEIIVSAIPLKSSEHQPQWLKGSKFRVFHAVNGQVQYKETRGYLAQTCKLPALKDRVVVVVDASGLTFKAHNAIWKGDRENVSNTTWGERYRILVTAIIRDSEPLRTLQNKIAQQELENATKAQNNTLFERLLKQDRNLAALLTGKVPEIKMPASGGKDGGEAGTGKLNLRHNPTFVRFEEKPVKVGLEIPINRTRPVACRTDVENDYLRRPVHRGEIILPDEIAEKFSVREQLSDGRLALFFNPVKGRVNVGDVFNLSVALNDPEMPQAVKTENMVELRIVEASAEPKLDPKPKPEKPEDDKRKGADEGKNSGGGEDAPMVGLPPCVLLTKDGREIKGHTCEIWPSGMTEADGGAVEDLGDDAGMVYKINLDNAYHNRYFVQAKGDVSKKVVTQQYILGMRVLMLGMEQARRAMGEKFDIEVEEFHKAAARGAASTVLGIAQALPAIVNAAGIDQEDVVE